MKIQHICVRTLIELYIAASSTFDPIQRSNKENTSLC